MGGFLYYISRFFFFNSGPPPPGISRISTFADVILEKKKRMSMYILKEDLLRKDFISNYVLRTYLTLHLAFEAFKTH